MSKVAEMLKIHVKGNTIWAKEKFKKIISGVKFNMMV